MKEINKELKEQGYNFEIIFWGEYMDWYEAMEYAEQQGGRLPTVKELEIIYDIEKNMSSRPIYSEITGDCGAWSSGEYSATRARGVSFLNGVDYYFKTYELFVFVVRDVEKKEKKIKTTININKEEKEIEHNDLEALSCEILKLINYELKCYYSNYESFNFELEKQVVENLDRWFSLYLRIEKTIKNEI